MSQQDKMREFHRLVQAQRYREARGILETADDLDPRTVEKWQRWLNELHRDDRVLAGVQSDKADPEKAATDALQTVFGSVLALIVALVIVPLVYWTYTTPGPIPSVPVLLYSAIAGWMGWSWLAGSLSPDNRHLLGSLVTGVLLFILFLSGIPLVYYIDHLPLEIWLAGVALMLPFSARMAWLGGEWLGAMLGRLFTGGKKKD